MSDLKQELMTKIKKLNETLWEQRVGEPAVNEWLNNFAVDLVDGKDEHLHALFLLSNFMYFGSRQIRELTKALYRDLYRYPIIAAIRRTNGDTIDSRVIQPLYQAELEKTRFLGVGNPSESGCHLLYYFRQENSLPRDLFIHSHQVFTRHGGAAPALRDPTITRYVFIDDFSGSGKQGVEYSQEIVEDIKRLKPDAHVAYYVMFATKDGIDRIKTQTRFDAANALFELDASFKCFGAGSRYFLAATAGIDRAFCEAMCRRYGDKLVPRHPLGYDDCQLLIGFHHNTPDNTLPIIWFDEPRGTAWCPVFRRYPKLGWGGI